LAQNGDFVARSRFTVWKDHKKGRKIESACAAREIHIRLIPQPRG